MSRRYLIYISIFLMVSMALVVSLWNFDKKISWQLADDVSDKLSLSLRSKLEQEKENALRFAIILSENSDIVNALSEGDDDFGHMKLRHIINRINQHATSSINAQVITSDYLIFARSWDEDNTYAGMPLDVYREDLNEVKRHKKPRVSIEVGRRLGIKATVPVYVENKLQGFIEVLKFFDESTRFFQKFGIDLYVLLDDSYYETAEFMQNNPMISQYIVANPSLNMLNLKFLQRSDFKKLRQEHVLFSENKYVFYEVMHNGQAETIGAFVFVLSQRSLEHFANTEEDISFLLAFSRNNLYDIVKKEQYDNKLYHSEYDKALLALKDSVPQEDRELFMQEARDVFASYSKEELIAMMLRYKISKPIKGEIK